MDAFLDDQPPQPQQVAEEEEDPAAEFLAREQSELAGLQDDNFEVVQSEGNDNVNADSSEPEVEAEVNFDEDVPAMSDPESEPIIMNGSTPYTLPTKIMAKEEPEKIKIWREKQKEMLENKDDEEEKKKEELKLTAKKELEEWYARYNEQIEKSKVNNREASLNAEKEYVASMENSEPGQEWEKIANLCDFNPKSSRGGTRDVSRMRSILLQMKQNPPVKA